MFANVKWENFFLESNGAIIIHRFHFYYCLYSMMFKTSVFNYS